MTRDELLVELRSLGWSNEAFEIGLRARFHCEYCDRDLLASVDDYDAWQVDHIVPASRSGINHISNYALACKTCNFLKRHSSPAEAVDPVADRPHAIALVRALVLDRRDAKNQRVRKMREMIHAAAEAIGLGVTPNKSLERTRGG
jgi:5-methylcytosine-specific restriction endonuclease McrA